MLGKIVDTDRRELDTGGSVAVSGSDSTPDCHAMGKSVHSPTASLPPDPEDFLFNDYYRLCGAVRNRPCAHSLRIKVKVPCHTPSDSRFLVGSLKQRTMIWQLAKYSSLAPSEAALQSSSLWQRLTMFAALPSWAGALILASAEVDLPPEPSYIGDHRRRYGPRIER